MRAGSLLSTSSNGECVEDNVARADQSGQCDSQNTHNGKMRSFTVPQNEYWPFIFVDLMADNISY
jgi:hypothetical protein